MWPNLCHGSFHNLMHNLIHSQCFLVYMVLNHYSNSTSVECETMSNLRCSENCCSSVISSGVSTPIALYGSSTAAVIFRYPLGCFLFPSGAAFQSSAGSRNIYANSLFGNILQLWSISWEEMIILWLIFNSFSCYPTLANIKTAPDSCEIPPTYPCMNCYERMDLSTILHNSKSFKFSQSTIKILT
jgi:hypothetical protein